MSDRLQLSLSQAMAGSLVALCLWFGAAPAIAAQPPRPQATSATGGLPAQVDDSYLLGAGDRVRVEIFNVPEFTGEYLVLPNGNLNLPQIGSVPVGGRTLEQATQIISTRYASILRRPVVSVNLLSPRPITVAIAGEINRPGSYTLPSGSSSNDTVTPLLTRSLQLADGVTQAADLSRVEIRRMRPSGVERYTVDVWALLQSGDIRQDIRLRDGDSIFIPATAAVNLDDSRKLSVTNIAARNNRPLKITVVGEVYRPGPYTLLEGNINQRDQLINPNTLQVPSVTRAIQAAGGITQMANIRDIQVVRLTRSGPPQVITLNFWELLKNGDVLQDLPLQDGDTVKVPVAPVISDKEATELATASFSPDKITVNVVGEVERPGAISVPPNTPLNQALLTAGGFRQLRANKSNVTLVRLNPNGTVTKRDIAINLEKGVSDQNNPPLRNNDTLIVRRSTATQVIDTFGYFLSPITGALGVLNLFGLPR